MDTTKMNVHLHEVKENIIFKTKLMSVLVDQKRNMNYRNKDVK